MPNKNVIWYFTRKRMFNFMASPTFSCMLPPSCSYTPRCGLSMRVLLTRYSREVHGVRKICFCQTVATKVMKTKLILIILLANVTFRAQYEAVCVCTSWQNFRHLRTGNNIADGLISSYSQRENFLWNNKAEKKWR